jgi:hypothetical protein
MISAMAMLHGRMESILTMLGNGEKTLSDSEMQIRKKLRGN